MKKSPCFSSIITAALLVFFITKASLASDASERAKALVVGNWYPDISSALEVVRQYSAAQIELAKQLVEEKWYCRIIYALKVVSQYSSDEIEQAKKLVKEGWCNDISSALEVVIQYSSDEIERAKKLFKDEVDEEGPIYTSFALEAVSQCSSVQIERAKWSFEAGLYLSLGDVLADLKGCSAEKRINDPLEKPALPRTEEPEVELDYIVAELCRTLAGRKISQESLRGMVEVVSSLPENSRALLDAAEKIRPIATDIVNADPRTAEVLKHLRILPVLSECSEVCKICGRRF